MLKLRRASDLPEFLVDLLPGSREEVTRIVEEYQGTPGIAAYGFASEAFWWPIFEPALRSGVDVPTIRKCFDALELMLACPDQEVRDAAGIRITPYLLAPAWAKLVEGFAGPLTLADLQRAAGD